MSDAIKFPFSLLPITRGLSFFIAISFFGNKLVIIPSAKLPCNVFTVLLIAFKYISE